MGGRSVGEFAEERAITIIENHFRRIPVFSIANDQYHKRDTAVLCGLFKIFQR